MSGSLGQSLNFSLFTPMRITVCHEIIKYEWLLHKCLKKKKGNRNFLTLSLTFCPPAQMFSDLFQVFNK